MMITVYTLEQLDEFLVQADSAPTDDVRRNAWASLKVDHGMFGDFPEQLVVMDPYSPDYARKVGEFMRFLHGGDYKLADEGFDHDLSPMLKVGFPHSSRSPTTVGCYLISYGFVIRAMNLPVPSKILEIGCGTGALSIHLARMGYDLTAVDVNCNFTNHVATFCEGSPGKVTTIASDMNTLDLPPEYDAVLFYESFHHSYDHPATIVKAIQFLKPGGILVLAAEPVLPAQRDILPYPWGPRLDGETLHAIRRFGWMELGFTESYLFDLLLRNGLACRRISSNETHWADLIISRRVPRLVAGETHDCTLGASGLLMLATGWSESEMWGTWSRGPVAKILIDLSDVAFAKGATIEFDTIPFLPYSLAMQRVQVSVNDCMIAEWLFPQGEMGQNCKAVSRTARIGAKDFGPEGRVVLEFAIEKPISPQEVGLSDDTRKLGFAITQFTAHPY